MAPIPHPCGILKPVTVPLLSGILLALAVGGPPVSARAQPVEKMPGLLQRITGKNHGDGGAVLRISDRSGLLWEGAAGRVAGPGSAPMEPDTPFEIASVTKMVTAATVLRFVEEGRLDLDAKLADLLRAGQAKGFESVTIRQLLTHTSGLPDYWSDASGRKGFLHAFLREPGRVWEPDGILAYARAMRRGNPGEQFCYSDTNYVLLGLVLERLANLPLHRIFRGMIFDPLGMRDTWMSYRESPRGRAPSHRFEGRDDLHGVPRQSADWAGGGLVSTTADLEKLLRGMVSGGLFKKAGTLDLMRRAVPTGGAGITYGMGIYRVDPGNGSGELWGHDGHGNAFAYYWPERGLFFTGTLNQTKNDWWPLVEPFFEGPRAGLEPGGEDKTFDAVISGGWDSLYMYRGVNVLRNGGGYGSGIAWTALNLAWSPGENDSFSIDVWNASSTQGEAYRESDFTLAYTRSFEDLTLSFAYAFYYGYAPENFFSHELGAVVAYEIGVGDLTLIPSLGYFFNIGPDSADDRGSAEAGSSFLLLRLDGHLPVFRDLVAIEPWGAFGVNFQYNTKNGSDGEPVPFNGANNLECGISIPVKITGSLTISAYAAYSQAFAPLTGTAPGTFWGGGSLLFAF